MYPGTALPVCKPNDFASDLESVTSRIYKIRKKLNINAIQTVHGYGYRFEK
ncbi:helix-turn-helix domain-containing protein [Clostridium phoceensis]|uniref:helix-turn-helix domain-containing protein n=1 Tax=Clostridium phoceensis TaxID=1650661 RepID=UPI00349F5529